MPGRLVLSSDDSSRTLWYLTLLNAVGRNVPGACRQHYYPLCLLDSHLHKSFTRLLTYLLIYLFTSSRIGPFRFQAGSRERRPNETLVLCMLILCYSTFCYGCIFASVVSDLVFLQY